MRRPHLAFILVTIFLDMAGFGMVAPLLPLYVQRHSGGALLAGALVLRGETGRISVSIRSLPSSTSFGAPSSGRFFSLSPR
jgi:hypothetical protein